MVSTAGQSGGLFETIENDENSDFHRLFMLVNKGRGRYSMISSWMNKRREIQHSLQGSTKDPMGTALEMFSFLKIS